MQDFYIRTKRHWLKVSRHYKNKSFTFALGYTNEFKAFYITNYSNEFVPTIKDAKEFAKNMIACEEKE